MIVEIGECAFDTKNIESIDAVYSFNAHKEEYCFVVRTIYDQLLVIKGPYKEKLEEARTKLIQLWSSPSMVTKIEI